MSWRVIRRWSAGAVLVALIVVPAACAPMVRWRGIWRALTRSAGWSHPDGELFVAFGTVVVAAAWLWFVSQVIVAVVATRRAPGQRGGLVPAWVQFVLVSSAVCAAPGVAGAASTSPHAVPADPPALVSYVSGMVTAFLISAGAVGALEARRRRRWEGSVGLVEAAPDSAPERRHIEIEMRRASNACPVGDVRTALTMAARELVGDGWNVGERVVAVVVRVSPDGEVLRVHLSGASSPVGAVWQSVEPDLWAIRRGDLVVPNDAVDTSPAVVQLGIADDGGVWFIDLEAVGLFRVCSPFADDILRTIGASLALSGPMAGATVVAVGLDEVDLEGLAVGAATGVDVKRAGTLADAIEITRTSLGATTRVVQSTTTQQLRARSTGERFEPTVVVAHTTGDATMKVRPASGVAIAHSVSEHVSPSGWGLWFDEGRHVVTPVGVVVTPPAVGALDVDDVVSLLHAEEHEAVVAASAVVQLVTPWAEPDWVLMVRLFGQVDVVTRDGRIGEFERSKAIELIAWLCLHRGQSTRAAARTSLWDMDVRPATFANVVSDARRGLGRLEVPPVDDEWIGRTLSEDLPLHAAVVTDADLLRARVHAARVREGADAIAVLRPGLELVRGTPLLDTGFLWADAEGHMSSLVMLATTAAVELGTLYLDEGDPDGVFWATGQGLAVLPGHEELVALRMRAFAQRGDRAGVRHEWESYLRGLAADQWAGAEPAPKLKVLSAELLG